MSIYLDVLLILNLYVDFLIVSATQKILNKSVSFKRKMLVAFIGSLSSLVIFIPVNDRFLSVLISLLTALLLSLTAFGRRAVFKNTAILYIILCSYSGVTMLIWHLTDSTNIIIHNNIVYYDISPLFLIVSTLACYFIITVAKRIINRNNVINECKLILTYDNRSVDLCCMVDTGNTLKDTISDLPVAVIDNRSAKQLIGLDLNSEYDGLKEVRGFRLIPCRSVGGNGILAAFKPDSANVITGDKLYKIKIMVAVSNTDFSDGISSIIGSQALINGEEISNAQIHKKVDSKT